jgi:predicted TIM-barrel fold metal-dependent hydrolase
MPCGRGQPPANDRQPVETHDVALVAPWRGLRARRITIFGIERCPVATNFPVAGLRVGYDMLVRSVKRMVAGFAPEDQERFFWKDAKAFYRL